MSTRAMLADALLREAGHGGLWAWAMRQRMQVSPKPWDEVAEELYKATNGAVQIRGQMLRQWVVVAEREHEQEID